MMQKIQRFGGAMFTPVLLFAFAGITAGISNLCLNEQIIGSLARQDGLWYQIWNIVNQGAWTVFNHMPIVFVIGLPIGLAKKQNARACLEALVIYLTFNNFLNTILTQWGPYFGVDFTQDAGSGTGLTTIAGIKTLDMGMVGAIIISGIVVWLHNRYFDKELPEFLGIFKGSTYVYMLGFFLMIPVAFLAALIWPKVQYLIILLQKALVHSGIAGVGVYSFLNRILIPTGLHHFVYAPFLYDNVAVPGGITAYWIKHLSDIAQSGKPLIEMFPQGGFSLYGMEKVFGSVGIALAFFFTAKKERRKKVAGLLIPVTLTAMFAGVTEPLEFTFLFLCPPLFVVHSVLSGLLDMATYAVGVVGNFSGGLIEFASMNWIPLGSIYAFTYLKQILVGIAFVGIYFVVFRFLILKFDIKTPGREDNDDVKLFSKADYKEKKTAKGKGGNAYYQRAYDFLKALGGTKNIKDVTNCATRLRVTVNDPSLVQDVALFKEAGAHGLVMNGNAIQVIVGMDVANVRDEFESLMAQEGESIPDEKNNVSEQPEEITFMTLAEGTVIPLAEVKDDAFASGNMGPGVGIIPDEGRIYAPAAGEIAMIFDTGHAIGLRTEEGVEVLIHIGIDTVNLKGEGFTVHVKEGDHVMSGDLLVSFEKEMIEQKGYDVTTVLIVTDTGDYQKVSELPGHVKKNNICMKLQ